MEKPTKCYICKGSDISHIETRNPEFWTEYGSEIFKDRQIQHCNNCHFSFSTPFISDEKLNYFYRVDFIKKRTIKHSKLYLFIIKLINSKVNMMENEVTLAKMTLARQYMNFMHKKNILEIGGGSRESLKSITKSGVLADLFSIESVDVDKKNFIDQGAQVFNVDLTINTTDSIPELTGNMDIIISNHVLEHFNANKLDIVMGNIHNFLKTGGLFVFDVPRDDFSTFLEKGIRNQGCHLVHYTKKNITILLQKSGFEVLYCEYTGTERPHLDNYPYPEVPFEKTSETIWVDHIRKKGDIMNKIQKVMPSIILFFVKEFYAVCRYFLSAMRRYLLDAISANKNKHQLGVFKPWDYNLEGTNIRICAKKSQKLNNKYHS